MPPESPSPKGVTGKLSLEEHHTLILPGMSSFSSSTPAREMVYHPTPSSYRKLEKPPTWRIILKFGSTGQHATVGLDVHADTVFGRGANNPDSPDLDLTNLGAMERGVSRRHAMLRPTPHKLYLIDLGSTNGTFVNAIPVSRGMAQTLRTHDAISFGGLNCVVEIVLSPASWEGSSMPEQEHAGEAVPLTLEIGAPKTGRETIAGARLNLPPLEGKPASDTSPEPTNDLKPKT